MEIKRDLYLQKLIDRRHNGLIKVVTGVRRCGKSYLVFKMKKTILLVVAVMGFAFAAKAQNNAIGARISGGNQWYCAEISYQRSLDAPNRIETDLGYRVDDEFDIGYLFLTGVYQLHFDISSAKNLGWYFGFGPRLEILYYDGHSGYDNPINFAGAVGVVGQLGMDYHFNAIPLQLALDFRPCLYLVPNAKFRWADFGMSIRYMF